MRYLPFLLIFLSIGLCGCLDPAAQASRGMHLVSLAQYVDPFIGTAGDGNVFPGADVPFGMVQFSPESTAGGLLKPGGYNDGDLIIRGFALTHLSGAGCVAFENFPLMPTVRPLTTPPQPNGSPYSDRFDRASERAVPGYYGVRLASGIQVHLTVTPRTGLARFIFPASRHASILIDAGNGAEGTTNVDGAQVAGVTIHGRNEITGWATAGRFCGLPNRFTVYFAARFDRPFRQSGTWSNTTFRPVDPKSGSHQHTSARGPHTGAYISFDTRRDRQVEVKIGLSYTGVAGAEANLRAENSGWNFNTVSAAAYQTWNTLLDRVQATGGSAAEERTFYTALYHAFLFPSVFSDADGRYIGFDGHLHQAHGHVQYANFSGWDIYRSEVPLLAWLAPRQTSDMMESLVNDARQGGRLPKWPVANDYTGEMDGDSADPILAGAFMFGAQQFDAPAALHAMVLGASVPGSVHNGYVERPGLADYLRLGWSVAGSGGWGAAAETLEYAGDDFAIAQLAKRLGDLSIYRTFQQRAGNWRRLWNSATGFLQARDASGEFIGPFNPTSTDGFVEGNALQYLWLVPQDLPMLDRLLGSSRAAVSRLDHLFARFADGPNSPYYWPGNEPALEAPWEYDFFGAPQRTQAIVRRIVTTVYGPTRAGLPGNDDLGALSSWYVWAAIGLYPEIPGVAGLALGSPLFPHVIIHPPGAAPITISAPGAAPNRPYVATLSLNGRPIHSTWLPLSRLAGGKLAFTLNSHG